MGVDTIALVAMVGSLALGEELAGLVVGLMFSGGCALEEVASTRARRELTALVERAPKIAAAATWTAASATVPVERVQPATSSSSAPARSSPSTGRCSSAEAVIDTSTLTGEPLPRDAHAGACRCSAARPTPAAV